MAAAAATARPEAGKLEAEKLRSAAASNAEEPLAVAAPGEPPSAVARTCSSITLRQSARTLHGSAHTGHDDG